MNQMLLALIVVSNLVVIFTRAEASGNRVKEVLDTENSILEAEISTTPDFSSESILAFDHVDFRYTPDSGLSLQGMIPTFIIKVVAGDKRAEILETRK